MKKHENDPDYGDYLHEQKKDKELEERAEKEEPKKKVVHLKAIDLESGSEKT